MKGLIYNRAPASSLGNSFLQIEFREWGLLATAIIITLLLTAGIISFAVPAFHASSQHPDLPSNQILRSLIGVVLLFDFYSIYQQLQIQRMRRQLLMRDKLFRLIGKNQPAIIPVSTNQGIPLY